MKNYTAILIVLSILLLLVSILSVCIGAVKINFSELGSIIAHRTGWSTEIKYQPQQEAVLFSIRLPRVVLGILVGSALSVSGAAMQGLFRNPLAEPGLIGISAGAMLFAVVMIVLETTVLVFVKGLFGYYALSIAAFAGACLTTFLVYGLSMRHGKADITSMLLAGIAINALAGAFTGLLTYLATDEQLRNITFWGLGSLGGASWKTVSGTLPFVLVPVLILPFLGKQLNGLVLGEAQALHMGINIHILKKVIIILATMGVGASVAVSGMIGFIGLVIPHIIRMAVTADNRLVIPASALLGAAVLVLADLLSRTIAIPAELPIGIITAMIGTPVFIYIIRRERQRRIL